MASQSHIHHGPWINWSQGLILGATITFSDRSGGLLTSFIATFITLVGTQLWRILCYALHQIRSSNGPQDGLHHQQQVIFRNIATPGAAAWTFTQQAWYWRSKARLSLLRTLPWALLSLFYLIIFALAAVFSSDISKAPGPQRLLVSDTCGYFYLNSSDSNAQNAFQEKITHDSLTAATYARACYGDVADALHCSRYPVPSIGWTADQNGTCPFIPGLCVYGDTAAYKMTTGTIDSQTHLGINTPERSRIQYSRSVTCAPIRMHNYSQVINGSTENGPGVDGDKIWRYYLGPIYDARYGQNVTNYTMQYNTHSWLDSIGYTLMAYSAYAGVAEDGYVPIPALNQTHADLSIMMIAGNAIRFDEPCDDPIFGAHIKIDAGSAYGAFYETDLWVGTIACSETHIICNPHSNICTPSLGSMELLPYIAKNHAAMGLDGIQIAITGRLTQASLYTTLYHSTYTRMASALRAQETVTQLDQGTLPNNQWHIEVGSWFDAALSRLQQGIQEYATGPSLVPPGSYIYTPSDLPEKALCYSQIINDSSNTMSFSILGMTILFIIGGIIIITSLTIERIIGFIQRKWSIGESKRAAWLIDDKLQLQRLLFQETGAGVWNDDCEVPIPVTETKERILGVVGATTANSRSNTLDSNGMKTGMNMNVNMTKSGYGPVDLDSPVENMVSSPYEVGHNGDSHGYGTRYRDGDGKEVAGVRVYER